MRGLLVEGYFGTPELAGVGELAGGYAPYGVVGQPSYRNARIIEGVDVGALKVEVSVVKAVFLSVGGKVAGVCGDDVQEEFRPRVFRSARLLDVDQPAVVFDGVVKVDVKVRIRQRIAESAGYGGIASDVVYVGQAFYVSAGRQI